MFWEWTDKGLMIEWLSDKPSGAGRRSVPQLWLPVHHFDVTYLSPDGTKTATGKLCNIALVLPLFVLFCCHV